MIRSVRRKTNMMHMHVSPVVLYKKQCMFVLSHSKKLKLKCWTLPCQERFKFGASDPEVCETAYFIPVLMHGACAIMRVSVVPRKLMLLIGKDTLKVLEAKFGLNNNIGIFSGAGDFEGKVLRGSRAGHLMVPLLPESFWEFHDSFVPSETTGTMVFSTNVMNVTFFRETVTKITNHT